MILRVLALSLLPVLTACSDQCFIDGLNCTNEAPPFATIAAGSAHTCAGSSRGVVCWGAGVPVPGEPSELRAAAGVTCGFYVWAEALRCAGEGVTANAPDGRFLGFALGTTHGCAITNEFDGPGGPVCWGDIGAPIQLDFVALAAGAGHTCGVTADGTIACWGRDDLGQSTPPDGITLHGLAASDGYTCGLDPSDAIVCWGAAPADPPSGEFAALATGPSHACALGNDGAIRCWGDARDDRTAAPSGAFTAIAVGERHGCAITVDARVVCWGADDDGQASPP